MENLIDQLLNKNLKFSLKIKDKINNQMIAVFLINFIK